MNVTVNNNYCHNLNCPKVPYYPNNAISKDFVFFKDKDKTSPDALDCGESR